MKKRSRSIEFKQTNSQVEGQQTIESSAGVANETLLPSAVAPDPQDQSLHSVRSIYFEARNSGIRDDGGIKENNENGEQPQMDRGGFRKRHKLSLKSNRSFINRFRLFCGKLINNEYVQLGMIGLIIINAVLMGVATFDFVTEFAQTANTFQKVDTGFLTIFTMELVMQAIYYGWHLLQDAWLIFDLLIISLSWALDGLQIIRAFRIFRAFRLITRIKVLRDLVTAIGEVIPRMTAIGALLILIFYIFAVLFTELFQDLTLSQNYFKTLDASLFTCYEMMTLEWADLAREVMEKEYWAWAPFLAFIAITGFIVFNLIIAVICDAVSIVDRVAREREAAARGEKLESVDEKLEFAQEKIDELSDRVEDMMKHQKDMQDMLELLATELYRMELDDNVGGRKKKKKNKLNGSGPGVRNKSSRPKSALPDLPDFPAQTAEGCPGSDPYLDFDDDPYPDFPAAGAKDPFPDYPE